MGQESSFLRWPAVQGSGKMRIRTRRICRPRIKLSDQTEIAVSLGRVAYRQVILLEEVWSELFLLNAVQWCLPLESSPLFSAAELTALTLSPHTHPHSGLHLQTTTGKPSQVAADVRHLHDTLQRYKAVMVDPAEFACMKAIVLFRPGE